MSKRHPRGRRKTLLIFSVVFCLGIALTASFPLWLPLPGIFLSPSDDLAKADCIVPLRGNDYGRLRKAVQLFHEGYAKQIVVSTDASTKKYGRPSSGPDRSSDIKQVLDNFDSLGKNPQGIFFTDKEARTTYEEALATKQLMLQKNFHSLILVTDPYHMRRALVIFNLVFRETGIKIYHSAAESGAYDPFRWWDKKHDLAFVQREYLSLAYNLLYHFILKR